MRFKWKGNKENYNKKGFLKISSILLLCIFILGLIVIPKSEPVSADEIKPKIPLIDITYLGTNPQEPMVGQDIEVRYQVTPQPFQYKISKPKEIVLVLDASGSMDGIKLTNLKAAANTFINKLKDVKKLKVGIVVYSTNADINPISGTVNDKLFDITDQELKDVINGINAGGGTNTGEGLRKGEYLLSKDTSNADKTLILMSDGEPTFYSGEGKYKKLSSYDSRGQLYYYYDLDYDYTKIDNNNPRIGGPGGSDENGDCLEYAKKIGNIIRAEEYNIFSIGYGLDDEGNSKMQEIHTSMGGVVNKDPSNINNTFFASDNGAIESIFNKIADKLLDSYSINDVKLSGNLGSAFTSVGGFEASGNNLAVIKVPPIVYELTKINGEDWYTAKPIIITFKIKANEVGKHHIFDSNSKLEYTAVDGKKISIPIADTSIVIKEFTIEDSKKLQVDFYPEKSGYLMGDSANVIAGFTKPKGNEFNFNNAKFDITNGIPTAIELKEGKPGLDFGTINEGVPTQQYSFNIKDNITETTNETTNHTINGKYSYVVKQDGSTAEISGSKDAAINIKRGSVLVEVVDTKGEKINSGIKVSLQDTSINSVFSPKESEEIDNGIVKFNTIPTGNYKVTLTNIPAGYEFTNGNEAIVSVNYENNIAKYKFVLNGENNDKPNIKVTLKSGENMSTTLGEKVDITYGITAESFEYNKYSNESKDVVLVIDTTSADQAGEYWKIKDSIKQQIVNEFMKNNNVKMGIVSFDDKGVRNTPQELTNDTGVINEYITNIIQTDDKRVDTNGDITKAIIEADRILQNGTSTNKSMVFVTFGDIKYEEATINNIREKKYNIFTTYVRAGGNQSNIRVLYKYLNGIDDNYIKNEGNNGNELMTGIMGRLKERLKGELINQYIVKDALLNFDLGESLDPISGFVSNSSKTVQVKIPEIKYILNTSKAIYEPQAINDIIIGVQPNRIGDIEFGTNNNISYKNLLGGNISKKIDIPKINVIDGVYEIKHGLYEGVKDKQISISEANVTIAGGTNVNFGAEFTTKSTIPTIDLDIDKNYENIKNIKVYKLVNGELVELVMQITQGSDIINKKSYKMVLPTGIAPGTKILIRYSAKLPNSRKVVYINNIKVGSSLKNATVTTTDTDEKDRLPDLF
ncbi:VWA domain-containing protein [Clostridium gasigenes]|uniref:vWA domain-containing protein n=1 Tax=Clostridium gasigenes TaxID=94869 RepID=UPI001C0E042A|nr:vWA domain-containing protein [Clostridium gasigenes]MBU3137897.1 VWA domain-containing protein [Clostridium gasigenes]